MDDPRRGDELLIHSSNMQKPKYDDKTIERERYDRRAKARLSAGLGSSNKRYNNIPAAIRAPYLHYAERIREFAISGACVLEIGAGTGEHTGYLLEKGAQVTASDISTDSLVVLYRQHAAPDTLLDTCVADMEALPFRSETFDLITAAGCLSYGDNNQVLMEIYRALRPGGVFVCVDSLNENPIYRLNRWLHYLRGDRSKSTLLRMPTIRLLDDYGSKFETVDFQYFGTLTFALPILRRVLHEENCAKLLTWFDGAIGAKRSAFKFIMIARKGTGPLSED